MNIREFCNKHGLDSQWRVRFKSLKKEKAWGLTSFEDKRIYLDPKVLTFHIFDMEQILLHEICHTLCDRYDYHGRRWQQIAKEKGVETEFMRYDWSKIEVVKTKEDKTPITIFYMNYEDAKYCCDNDKRCLEVARDELYLYDHDFIYRIQDEGVFTRSRLKKMLANKL